VEVLKSWNYFEQLRQLREESTPTADPATVAAAGGAVGVKAD
jgi:hypothetical protein